MNKDGEVITKSYNDNRKILIYKNRTEFVKREKALKKYCMGAYKYWIFDAVPKLQQGNKIDGKYELELPVDKKFQKIYGKVRVLFTVEEDMVVLEDIEPSKMLLDMFRKELPIYKGIPYRNEKDKFKIELMKE